MPQSVQCLDGFENTDPDEEADGNLKVRHGIRGYYYIRSDSLQDEHTVVVGHTRTCTST